MKQQQIDIILILSTYNGEQYLDKQLKSIAAQDFDGNIMLLVRDDGSKDNTMDILKKWQKKIPMKILEDGENLGAAYSFWNLLKEAPPSKYYAFLDQDDIWEKTKLSAAVKALDRFSENALWFSNCRLIDGQDKILKESMNEQPPILTVSSQLVCGIAQGCSMVFNHALLKYCLEKNIGYIPMHDTVVFSYALASGTVIYDDCPYLYYRLHDNNVVAKQGKNLIGKIKSTYTLWIEHRYEVSKLASEIMRDNNEVLCIEDIAFLESLSKCRHHFKERIAVLTSERCKSNHSRALWSFRFRTLLGLI